MRDREISPVRMKIMVRDSVSFVPDPNVNPQVRFLYPAWIIMIDSSNLTTFSINTMPIGWVEISLFLIYVLPIDIYIYTYIFINSVFLERKGLIFNFIDNDK